MTQERPAEVSASGIEAARFSVRSAGYCVMCDRIVERQPTGDCPAGHPPEAIAGRLALGTDDAVPVLPRFNLAAFLLPMIWGPAHGQWAGAIFLPLWLFLDSTLRAAAMRPSMLTGVPAVVAVVATLAAMAWFGKRGNGLAWRRVADEVSPDRFAARQRVWAIASVPVFAVLMSLALYYDLVVAPVL